MTRPAAPLSATELAQVASDLRLACMRISRRVRFEHVSEIAPHQFSVLVRLEAGPHTPGELAEIERVAKPTMTKTVGPLVERGWVQRTADPADGRQVILSLTREGRATVEATRRRRDAWMRTRIGRLAPADQRLLAEAERVLARVAAE
jgi:DNA-binding MarR family transcriptional regulator